MMGTDFEHQENPVPISSHTESSVITTVSACTKVSAAAAASAAAALEFATPASPCWGALSAPEDHKA